MAWARGKRSSAARELPERTAVVWRTVPLESPTAGAAGGRLMGWPALWLVVVDWPACGLCGLWPVLGRLVAGGGGLAGLRALGGLWPVVVGWPACGLTGVKLLAGRLVDWAACGRCAHRRWWFGRLVG